ncbi:hypothetical protein, partial [Tardiphaga sp.]|uniref:hypothetical protein n=1 Tax=Tardiphaga sp. TaxID=1926292 RepID=UPI00262DA5A7
PITLDDFEKTDLLFFGQNAGTNSPRMRSWMVLLMNKGDVDRLGLSAVQEITLLKENATWSDRLLARDQCLQASPHQRGILQFLRRDTDDPAASRRAVLRCSPSFFAWPCKRLPRSSRRRLLLHWSLAANTWRKRLIVPVAIRHRWAVRRTQAASR